MMLMDHDALSELFFALPDVMANALHIVAHAWLRHLDLAVLERLTWCAMHDGS